MQAIDKVTEMCYVLLIHKQDDIGFIAARQRGDVIWSLIYVAILLTTISNS